MATRSSRAATTGPVQSTSDPVVFPEVWGSAEEIEVFAGHDLTDKKELIGVPFLITGVEIERNTERGYDVAYIYAVDVNGTDFEFSDTSNTGVKAQLQEHMVAKGISPTPGDGLQSFKLALMKGLRVSEFKVRDEESGRNKDVAIYYLTAGVRKNG